MKMAAVCGSGLGSSFMMEMNIQSVLKDLGVTGVEVSHYDLGSATPDLADVFFVGSDLASPAAHLGNVVVLKSIIDKDELHDRVKEVCEANGLL